MVFGPLPHDGPAVHMNTSNISLQDLKGGRRSKHIKKLNSSHICVILVFLPLHFFLTARRNSKAFEQIECQQCTHPNIHVEGMRTLIDFLT